MEVRYLWLGKLCGKMWFLGTQLLGGRIHSVPPKPFSREWIYTTQDLHTLLRRSIVLHNAMYNAYNIIRRNAIPTKNDCFVQRFFIFFLFCMRSTLKHNTHACVCVCVFHNCIFSPAERPRPILVSIHIENCFC